MAIFVVTFKHCYTPEAADGFSCRHQIRDGSGRKAVYAVFLLASALN